MPECQSINESLDSRQVRFQLLRLIQSDNSYHCFSWNFERSIIVGVTREEYFQWRQDIPRARLVRRCECWLVKRVELATKEKRVARLESYGHSKRERMTRSLNPLALAMGKVMIDYVFLFLEEEFLSKEKLLQEVERTINEERLYDATRKANMFDQVFGECDEVKIFKLNIKKKQQLKEEQSIALKNIVKQELEKTSLSNKKQSIKKNQVKLEEISQVSNIVSNCSQDRNGNSLQDLNIQQEERSEINQLKFHVNDQLSDFYHEFNNDPPTVNIETTRNSQSHYQSSNLILYNINQQNDIYFQNVVRAPVIQQRSEYNIHIPNYAYQISESSSVPNNDKQLYPKNDNNIEQDQQYFNWNNNNNNMSNFNKDAATTTTQLLYQYEHNNHSEKAKEEFISSQLQVLNQQQHDNYLSDNISQSQQQEQQVQQWEYNDYQNEDTRWESMIDHCSEIEMVQL